MSMPVNITDQRTGDTARVVTGNALAVAPSSPSESFNATFDVDDTPVEIVSGKANQNFCITGIILTGNKDISAVTDAVVTVYQATADDLTTSTKDLFVIPVARSAQSVITGILLDVPAGYYVMGETSDDDVFVTMLGFYVND